MHIFNNNLFPKLGISLILLLVGFHAADKTFSAPLSQTVASLPGYTADTLNDGLNITFSAGEIAWNQTKSGALPHIDHYSTESRPGYPQVPYLSVPFAIPAGAELDFEFETSKPKRLKTSAQIALSPEPHGVLQNSRGEAIGGDWSPSKQNKSAELYPVVIEEIGVMRGVRLGRAMFYPITFQEGEPVHISSASVEIRFRHDKSINTNEIAELPPSFSRAITGSVINPEHATAVKSGTKQNGAISPVQVAGVIYASEAGLTRVTGQNLIDAGLDLAGFNPQSLGLSHMGNPLPIQWDGNDDSVFSADESFIFYAPPFDSRWTRSIPILLSSTEQARQVMQTRPGTPPGGVSPISATVKTIIEQNPLYGPDCGCGNLPLGRDGDRWFWQELKRPGNPVSTVDANLTNLGNSSGTTLTVHLVGFTSTDSDVDHAVRILVNNTEIGTAQWDGKTAHAETFGLPDGLLQTTNQVSFELIETGSTAVIDGVWLDALEFTYIPTDAGLPEQTHYHGESAPTAYSISLPFNESMDIYDVTDPINPLRLTATSLGVGQMTWGDANEGDRIYAMVPADRYHSPDSIRGSDGLSDQAQNGASYLIITPQEFASTDSLAQLAELRRADGWQVRVETTEEIYSAFGHGEPTPEAIRDYLTWGYDTWSIRPEIVLLVGDGNTDPKKNRFDSRDTFVPPYLDQVDPWLGETAADNQFVAVDGDDPLPDMIIGRLPANSVTEVDTMVGKIISYEMHESPDAWNQDMLVVADDTDSGGNFANALDSLIRSHLRFPWLPERHYFDPDSHDPEGFNQNIIAGWNSGNGLVVYAGHSTNHQWARDRFLHLDDVANLENGDRLPLVLQLTCLTGAFHSTPFNSLDEQLVRQNGGGAIAVVSSTGLGVATGHHYIADELAGSIYTNRNPDLGAAFLAGKLNLALQTRSSWDLLDTYLILGDPALNVNLNTDIKTSFLPSVFN